MSWAPLTLKDIEECKRLLDLNDLRGVELEEELKRNPALREFVSTTWVPPAPAKQEPGHKNRKQRRAEAARKRKMR